jgi:hypothetical protein
MAKWATPLNEPIEIITRPFLPAIPSVSAPDALCAMSDIIVNYSSKVELSFEMASNREGFLQSQSGIDQQGRNVRPVFCHTNNPAPLSNSFK